MKIEVWSDFSCPFCYIGKRRLEEALQEFPHRKDVQVEYRSFELDPEAKRDYEQDLYDLLAKKFGQSREQVIAMNQNLKEQAKSVGLSYHFDSLIPTNTFDAHRLTHHAESQGKAKEMVEHLFKAYFTDSHHIGDRETLAQLASEIGLEKETVKAMLKSEKYAADVRSNEKEAKQLSVTGVPFFVFNRKYAISGAQPPQIFKDTLEKVWEEENQ